MNCGALDEVEECLLLCLTLVYIICVFLVHSLFNGSQGTSLTPRVARLESFPCIVGSEAKLHSIGASEYLENPKRSREKSQRCSCGTW